MIFQQQTPAASEVSVQVRAQVQTELRTPGGRGLRDRVPHAGAYGIEFRRVDGLLIHFFQRSFESVV